MLSSRWWLVAMVVAAVAPIVYLVTIRAPAPQFAAGVAVSLMLFGAFVWLRRRAECGNTAAIVLTVLAILYAGVLTAIDAPFAITQCIAHPLVWVLARNRRGAIIATGGVAIAVAVGFSVSLTGPGAWQQLLITQLLSFGFSVVMGNWIWHISDLGDEKARLLDELTAAQDELAALHRDAGVTDERARLSREMHDTVAQSLTGLVLLTQRARRSFTAGALDDDTLDLIETTARDALAETRALVAAAAPVELSTGGITDALHRLGERFERETRIRVQVSATLEGALDRGTEVVVLRCAQEGLANVRKHAKAATARVTLTAAAGTARLTVTDDGRGFAAQPGDGFGLAGLRDRLAIAGGTLDIDGTPGATALTATLPYGGGM
jgi:signal transduction histidine kinase